MQITENSQVRGIVLAGDHRWGESAFACLLPRPLMPVADSPLICYALRWLRDGGVCRNTICANSDSYLIRELLGDGVSLGLDLSYSDDLSPRGPAGCVKDAAAAWPAEEFVVVEGSAIPTVDLAEVLAAHRQTGAALTVVVARGGNGDDWMDSAWPTPVGIYVFGPRAMETVPATGYQDIKEVLIPRLHGQRDTVTMHEVVGGGPRVTGFDAYMDANAWMVERVASGEVNLPGYERRGGALAHASARIADGARLVGPVLVGPHARIEAGAMVIGPTVLGRESRVAAHAVVCRSVVWEDCHVGESALVDQCTLASAAYVEPFAVCRDGLLVGRPTCPAHPPQPARSAQAAQAAGPGWRGLGFRGRRAAREKTPSERAHAASAAGEARGVAHRR